MGNEDLGKHYSNIGENAKAFDAFNRMRDKVTDPKHIVGVSKYIIDVAIEQRHWIAVSSHLQKIRSVAQVPEEGKIIQPYLSVSAGLAHMATGEFKQAAANFLQADSGIGSRYNYAFSANDIAIYGGLCALASMERHEMQVQVLDNANFRTYLELEPHIRRAITFFVNGRYAACLAILDVYYADYQLDIYLQKHVADLYYLIRSKSMVQYLLPFSCVTLDSMQAAFGHPGIDLEHELDGMIRSGALNARIDTQNRVGHSRTYLSAVFTDRRSSF